VDTHGHVQVLLVVMMLWGVALGVILATDSAGLATRTLDRVRGQPVTGRIWARMPVWVIRVLGVWSIVAGVAQFSLFRYLPH
jgi:hypothetical protein